MKTKLNISVLVFLLFAASSQCFAARIITGVSKNRAENELGVKIKSELCADGRIGVRLEFMPLGNLERFHHAELDISSEGRRLLSATLKPLIQTETQVVLYFSADPSYVKMTTLTVIVRRKTRWDPDGYSFAIKDFVNELTFPLK